MSLAANIDYVPVGISLTFPAGSGPLTSLESVLVPLDDIRVEPNKSLTLNASIAAGTGSITPNGSTALVVIQDNDGKLEMNIRHC